MVENRRINILIVYIALVIIFVPRSFAYIDGLRLLYEHSFFGQVVIGLLFFALLSTFKGREVVKPFAPIGFFLFGYISICCIHGGDYSIMFHVIGKYITMYLFVCYELKRHKKDFFTCVAVYFTVCVILNASLMLWKPEGLGTLAVYSADNQYRQIDRVNYLEVDNRLSLPILTSMFSSFYLLHFSKKYVPLCTLSVIFGGLTNYLTKSGTGIISYGIFAVLCLYLYTRNSKCKLVNLRSFFILYIVALLLIVYSSSVPLVSLIVKRMLGKDLTFSGRIFIWRDCITKIIQQPLFGYGNFESGWTLIWRGIKWNAHNIFMDVTYQGGVVLLASYLLMVGSSLLCIDKLKTKESQLMTSFMFSLYIIMLCESFFDNNFHLFMVVLGANARIILNINKPYKNTE